MLFHSPGFLLLFLPLALALLHHLVIAANVPVSEVVAWLAGLDSDLVIEFVSKDDPMVKRLLLNKEDRYTDYRRDFLERRLESDFKIVERHQLTSGTRTLYYAQRRGAGGNENRATDLYHPATS